MSRVYHQSDHFSFGFTPLARKDPSIKGIVLSIEMIKAFFHNITNAAKLVVA